MKYAFFYNYFGEMNVREAWPMTKSSMRILWAQNANFSSKSVSVRGLRVTGTNGAITRTAAAAAADAVAAAAVLSISFA